VSKISEQKTGTIQTV